MRWWAPVCAALAVASCGGSASSITAAGPVCAQVTPCGGNMLGTWKLVSECLSGSVTGTSPTGCTPTVGATVDSIAGTITFNADGTYVSSVSTTSTLATMLSPACLTANGDAAPQACDSLNRGTCVPSAGGCGCTSKFMSAAVMNS